MVAPGHGGIRPLGPPKKRVTTTADMVIVFMNSARQNMPNRIEEYSVWNPPTSSESASVRSNGGRVSSAVMAIMKKMNGTKPRRMRFQFQNPFDCAATMARVEMEWLTSTTVTTVMPSAASYEMTCADALTDPRSGYLDPDDHPASMT